MQEWLNWPAWKASKPQKGFRGSNPLLSALRNLQCGFRFFVAQPAVMVWRSLPGTVDCKHAFVNGCTVQERRSNDMLISTHIQHAHTSHSRGRKPATNFFSGTAMFPNMMNNPYKKDSRRSLDSSADTHSCGIIATLYF